MSFHGARKLVGLDGLDVGVERTAIFEPERGLALPGRPVRHRVGPAGGDTTERLAKLPFTTGNDAELLIDGDATFASIFAGMRLGLRCFAAAASLGGGAT